MSWSNARGAFVRFITWRSRLNRMQFGVGYVSLAFGGGIVMQMGMFALAAMLGGLEEVFEHPQWVTPLFLPVVIMLFGLIAARAHDIGWPGWPIVVLYLIPLPAWVVVMSDANMLDDVAADPFATVPFEVLMGMMFVPALLTSVALIVLASVPGQKRENCYGAAIAPGLWNDLPPDRA